MKAIIIRALLRILNSRWLNQTPCEYGFIGNVEAFSIGHLRSEEKARPGITVAQIIREADAFRCCPLRKDGGVTVLQDGEEPRDATIWDLHDLRTALDRKDCGRDRSGL